MLVLLVYINLVGRHSSSLLFRHNQWRYYTTIFALRYLLGYNELQQMMEWSVIWIDAFVPSQIV